VRPAAERKLFGVGKRTHVPKKVSRQCRLLCRQSRRSRSALRCFRKTRDQEARRFRAHLLCVRRRLAAFSRSACWTAHLSTSDFTRFCNSSFSFGDSGRGAGVDLNSLSKLNPRKKSLNPSTIVKSSRACSRKRFFSSSFVSFG